jgi:hypothetical protein
MIPPQHFCFEKNWSSFKSSFISFLKKHHVLVEEKFYECLACSFPNSVWSFECLLPRIENFFGSEHEHQHHHRNFQANYMSYPENRDVRLLWKRRDFSINSMGVSWYAPHHVMWNDPFGGFLDLQKNMLRPIHDHFYKDPVRFLRLIRFKRKYCMTITEDCLQNLFRFHLDGLKEKQLWDEAFKDGDIIGYIQEVCFFTKKYQLIFHQETWMVMKNPYKKWIHQWSEKISTRNKQEYLVHLLGYWRDQGLLEKEIVKEKDWDQWSFLWGCKKKLLKKIYEAKKSSP